MKTTQTMNGRATTQTVTDVRDGGALVWATVAGREAQRLAANYGVRHPHLNQRNAHRFSFDAANYAAFLAALAQLEVA